jgi:hypothetical protein
MESQLNDVHREALGMAQRQVRPVTPGDLEELEA